MSNKATIIETDTSGVDIDTLTTIGTRYFIRMDCTNKPIEHQGHLEVNGFIAGFAYQIFIKDSFNQGSFAFMRVLNSGLWGDWIQFATATPPQEFTLPLAAGLTDAGSEYRKNQFNEVTVGLAVSGAIAAGAVVATLPAGYRPKAGKQMSVTTVSGSGTAVAGFCLIEATGHIINQCGAVSKLVGERSYVAAGK